jgi:predicted ATPase
MGEYGERLVKEYGVEFRMRIGLNSGPVIVGAIGVDQLTIQSSGELVQAILEGTEVEAELKELILNRAAGNPLFMEEFTHSKAASHRLGII